MSVENDVQLRKSNPLIQSLGNPSALANKIMLASLVHAEIRDPSRPSPLLSKEDWKRIKEKATADYTKGLVAIFPQSEIKQLSKKSNSGSYYKYLNELLNTDPRSKIEGFKALQNQWNVIFSNKGFHETVSLITACAYDEDTRMVFVKFSDEEKIQNHLYGLKGNYTVLSYKKMMQFKTNYASRMYEIVKSRIDYEEAKTKVIKPRYEFTYNIAHLKYMIGVLNPFYSGETIKMLGVSNPDYDATAELIKGEGMPKWYDFKRNCLEKCKKEINAITEFNFDYDAGKPKGRGGKIVDVTLYVERKEPLVELSNNLLTEDDVFDLIDQIRELLTVKLSSANIKELLKIADYDIDKVKAAIGAYNDYKEELDDYPDRAMGYLVKALKEGWKAKPEKTPIIKNNFNNFSQNQYDFDELEQLLVDN